ncbi:MAG: hypothetical protein BAJALOKI2v1_220030 [Promethearchaeota archaeon]|nr:MAG: hypothetical protein BAJALOKI2v1_220030 [Candidatus Lokiarchaeota archaeon]
MMDEISAKEKVVEIKDVSYDVEEESKKKEKNEEKTFSEDLSNPGAIDFIRRCKTKEEAFEILDYLLKREEIDKREYNSLKKKLEESDGLNRLISSSGGFKKPGYYMRKYYQKLYLDKKPKDK